MFDSIKLVTIKLPRNPNHDPRNKVTGPCPLSPVCTDSTGEHHTGLISADELEKLRDMGTVHITRVEDIP